MATWRRSRGPVWLVRSSGHVIICRAAIGCFSRLTVWVFAGEFPVMRPGKVHEYSSCTTFSTPSEYMEGHYTFHRLGNVKHHFLFRGRGLGSSRVHINQEHNKPDPDLYLSANKEEVFQVAIPRFHMVCPPYREPVGRTVNTQLNVPPAT